MSNERRFWNHGEKAAIARELKTTRQYLSYVLATGKCGKDFARRLSAVCVKRGLNISAEELIFRENSFNPLLEPTPYQKHKG